MLDLLANIVSVVHQDKAERLKQFKTAKRKMTEEDEEEFYEDVERIDRVITYIMEITGVCLRTMPAICSDKIKQRFVEMFAKPLLDVSKAKEYELTCSLCFFCDCLEHGSEALVAEILKDLPAKFFEVLRVQ